MASLWMAHARQGPGSRQGPDTDIDTRDERYLRSEIRERYGVLHCIGPLDVTLSAVGATFRCSNRRWRDVVLSCLPICGACQSAHGKLVTAEARYFDTSVTDIPALTSLLVPATDRRLILTLVVAHLFVPTFSQRSGTCGDVSYRLSGLHVWQQKPGIT